MTSRLLARIERLQRTHQPKGRLLVVVDDGSEDLEARIASTRATPADLIVVITRFTRDPERPHQPITERART